MGHDLEAPGTDAEPDWDSLYRARGPEVAAYRPVFTGDVFAGANVGDGEFVMVLQHPCAIRVDGLTLAPRLLVAKVTPHEPIKPSLWAGRYYRLLPLSQLIESDVHHAAVFTEHHVINREQLDVSRRIAFLSQTGLNLLLQRWVHHNSRVVVPTFTYQEFVSPQFEEADIIENWCSDREDDGIDLPGAAKEIDAWLGDKSATGVSARESLKNVQHRSAVRQAVRKHLKEVRRIGHSA